MPAKFKVNPSIDVQSDATEWNLFKKNFAYKSRLYDTFNIPRFKFGKSRTIDTNIKPFHQTSDIKN